jgi:dihydropteroate synthase
MKLLARGRTLEFPRRPLVMGIINLCADSFSGDGIVNVDRALARAREIVAQGADIIDIGGESAGTKRAAMAEVEEIGNLLPFVERFYAELDSFIPQDEEQLFPPLLSINTWRPAVARAVLSKGGDLLNDIGALPTDENARICAETGAALLIMHTVGQPKVAHTHVGYTDIWETLEHFFEEKIALAENAGVPGDALILDPGIDFAKQRDDNLRIYREFERIHRFGCPVLLPVSRKTVIGDVLNLPPAERDAGTVSCIVSGIRRGAQIFRVHNVVAASQAVRTLAAVSAPTRIE